MSFALAVFDDDVDDDIEEVCADDDAFQEPVAAETNSTATSYSIGDAQADDAVIDAATDPASSNQIIISETSNDVIVQPTTLDTKLSDADATQQESVVIVSANSDDEQETSSAAVTFSVCWDYFDKCSLCLCMKLQFSLRILPLM